MHHILKRRYYKILFLCDTIFPARNGYHGMIGLPSTAATATNDNSVYGMISSWSQNPGSSNYWYDTLFRGVICREKGVICQRETTNFQCRHSRFFRYDTGDKPWAHAAHIVKLSDPVLIFLTLGPWLPLHLSLVHGFSCLKQLCRLSYHSSNLLIPHWQVIQALQSLIWC